MSALGVSTICSTWFSQNGDNRILIRWSVWRHNPSGIIQTTRAPACTREAKRVKSIEDVIQWARTWSDELESEVFNQQSAGSVDSMTQIAAAGTLIETRVATAIEFFRQYVDGSVWLERAKYNDQYRKKADAAKGIGDLLRGWAQQVETGTIPTPALAAMEVRVAVSTDLWIKFEFSMQIRACILPHQSS
jgi:hypothetical protein